MANMDIESPVIYVDPATVMQLKTGNDPVATLTNAFAVARQTGGLYAPTNDPFDPPMINRYRTYAVVVNALDGPIEGVEAADIHGYWIGEPMVPDAHGDPIRTPSSAAAQGGGTSTDWIDSAGPGQASIGLWVFQQGMTFFHGVSFVLHVALTNEAADLMMTLIIDPLEQVVGIGADLYPSSGPNPPSANDYYSAYDGKTVVPAPLVHNNLTVTIRHVDKYLFAIVEST